MTLFRKLVPSPLLSVALLALWLALSRSTSVGQILLGLALALSMPILTSSLRPTRVRVRRPLVVIHFIVTVAYDALVSSFQVAWGILVWRWRKVHARFVTIPLDLRDPFGLAVLAMVTTVVPGTVWSEITLDCTKLRLHVWDVGEEAHFVARYKARYEKPLREIFE